MLPAGKLGALAILLAGLTAVRQGGSRNPGIESVPRDAIRVRVVDDDGRALAGVEIALKAAKPGEEEPAQARPQLWYWKRGETRTGSDGSALLTGVGAGSWRVAAGAPPEWAYHVSEPTAAGEEVVLVLSRLPGARVVSGVVLRPDGVPQQGAYVRFVWNDRGEEAHARCISGPRGDFTLLADRGARGTLHARMPKLELRSTAATVAAGTTGIELRLGEPRRLTLDLRDQLGRPADAHVEFFWELEGFLLQDYPGQRRVAGEPPSWELPTVPFHLEVVSPLYERVRLGPFDPEEVGSRLTIDVRAFPRVRGRVTRDGAPVEGAQVTLRGVRPPPHVDVELTRAVRPPGSAGKTDADGRFDLDLRATEAATYELHAWERKLGEGTLGPIELDPGGVLEELEIELTRPPGAIAGRVVLPADHDPAEIWLTATDGHGYSPLAADGSFLLTDLPPGPVTVHVVASHAVSGAPMPVSTTVSQRAGDAWFYVSHGPECAPDWLPVQPAFEVDVRAGETVALDIDLVEPAAFELTGRFLLNGEPPPYRPTKGGMYWDRAPQVALDRGGGRPGEYLSRTDLARDGSFAVRANETGTYRLMIRVPTVGDDHPQAWAVDWVVLDRVRLDGEGPWEHDVPAGSLRVLPREKDGQIFPFDGKLCWKGPGDLRIFVPGGDSGARDATTRAVFYPQVPAGRIELFHDTPEGRVTVLEAEVRPGETTTVRLP